jgi:hypothetical protein
MAFLLTLFRILALLLLGIREREGIAVSVIYVPLMLACAAGLMLACRRAATQRDAAWLGMWFLVGVGVMQVGPLAVSDNGFVLCFVPPMLCVAAAFVPRVFDRPIKRLLMFFPTMAVVLLLAGSVAVAIHVSAPAQIEAATPAQRITAETASTALDRFAGSKQNEWRLLTIYSPASLETAGTTGAEQMRRWRYLLASFTSSPDGHGLGYRAQISDLRSVQADDNVSAIHLMAPFGRNGAAAFLLVIGIMAWGAVRASPAPLAFGRAWGMLAVWTVFAVDSYMVLANLVLVPFTGRNVYLMAAHSESDLVEALLLFAIAFGGLSLPRAGEGE